LHFARLGDGDTTGAGRSPADAAPIVFDVQLQGKVTAAEVTLQTPMSGAEEGEINRAMAVVREFDNVQVTDNLIVKLVAKKGRPRINAIEVLRTPQNP
jgi:hypothetical protein